MASVTDPFTRADETPLAGDWEAILRTAINLANNQLVGADFSGDPVVKAYKASTTNFADDQSATITIINPTLFDDAGVAVRCVAAGGGSGYYAVATVADNKLRLFKLVAGTETLVQTTTPITWANNDTIGLSAEASGADVLLKAYQNGVQANVTYTDNSSPLTGGQPGVVYYRGASGTTKIETWTGADLVATPVIADIDTDESITATQTNIVATVTGAGATQGASTFTLVQGSTIVAQTIDSWADTSIQFDCVFDSGATDLKYGAATATLTVGGIPGTLAITITAPAGKAYVDLASVEAVAGNRFTSTPDLEIGDQIEAYGVVGGTISDVTLNNDGTWNAAVAVTGFYFRVWDADTSTWGTGAFQSTVGLTVSPSSSFIGLFFKH